MYAIRPRSKRWKFVSELRQSIENQREETAETNATIRTVRLADAQADYLDKFLRRRSLFLLLAPWRDRERRDVRRLRRQLLDQF